MIVQGTPEWFELRAGKITASNFDSVLSPNTTAGYNNYALRLALERVNNKPLPEKYTSWQMQQGIEREPIARSVYEVARGTFVEEVGFVDHPSVPMVGSSPDGFVDDGGIEIKCPEHAAHFKYLGMELCPQEYVHQVQGNLWITGRKWWDFISYNPDFPESKQIKIIRVLPDFEYHKKLAISVFGLNAYIDGLVKKLEE